MDRDGNTQQLPIVGPDSVPSARNETPGSVRSLGPGQSKKRTAREHSTDDNVDGNAVQKRRRRAFSCLSCQKLKCRCEYDPGAQGCHRCQTLRIVCSLRGQHELTPSVDSAGSSRPTIEERLQRHEYALTEIKSMLQALKSDGKPSSRSPQTRVESDGEEGEVPAASTSLPDPEYLSKPVDRGSNSAPIAVLRAIGQVTGGQRPFLGHGYIDLVQLQLLDEQTASDLIELFIKNQSQMLYVGNYEELRHSGDKRRVSAFLHSVCCLMGVVYRDDILGMPLHRQIYEQVRLTLGQVALSSPLDLDDLNALFIMSNNATTPSKQGVEYIDSWLLSGYCAQQAILSISFTQIVNRLKNGKPTLEDHRAMHLWSIICLHHLHWSVTTGRPSIIPKGSHINQCNALLSFYQATMQDGMLVAEIMLYSTLHHKLLHESYPSDGRECEEFRAWKQKWNHVLTLPTSSMLRIGYHSACLILAAHAISKTEDALGSSSLLSTDIVATPATGGASIGSKPTPFFDEVQDSCSETTKDTEADASSAKAEQVLRINICKYAKLVVETFIEIPPFLRDAAPTCTCLCLGYCALVLAHYDSSQSLIPDDVVLRLITQLDHWMQASPGKSWLCKYGTIAKRKVEARNNAASCSTSPLPQSALNPNNEYQQSRGQRAATPPPPRMHTYSIDDVLTAAPVDDGLPSFDLGEQMQLPSMEGFFGGGFLDFMR